MTFERRRDGFSISDDHARLDVDAIHAFLSADAYWCAGIPRAVVDRALANSLSFGLYDGDAQIGLARFVTDRATFAWLCDVYVLPAYRARGLGGWLVASALEHPDLQGLRRILLATRDAHGLYRKMGFAPLREAERWMDIARPDVYEKEAP